MFSFKDDKRQSDDVDLAREAYQGELDMLRSQSSNLSHLVNILPAGVVILDGTGCVKEANQVAIDLLGEPLLGSRWLTVIKRAFCPQADDGHEVSLVDGRRVKIQTTDLSPQAGQLVLLTDLTETRLLQSRLANLSHLSVLGKLLASLAHQIRTPLSAALLYASNLANTALDTKSKSNFQTKLVARLHDLETQINDMLLFAKSGKQQVAEHLSLQQLLNEVKEGSEAMMMQCQGKLIVNLPEPDIIIFGNKNALASAIQNLIHNSIKNSPQALEINLSAQCQRGHEPLVCISVEDNGSGIELDKQKYIFEPFYTTQSSGTGLGLAVVKSVAEQHNGRVELSSEPGKGACFRILLPIAESDRKVA